jgi:3-phenylpropionate/trans-cinnamate dioxygenase ferredoxin subunit
VGEAVRVCSVAEIEPGTARRFDVAGTGVSVIRIEDQFYALGDTCSHEEYSLSDGEVWSEDCAIECPKHGSMFDVRTGEPQTLPATQPVPVFTVRVEGDDVVVEVS